MALLENGKKKSTVERESDNYTNRDCCFWYSQQRIIEGTEELGNNRTSGDHPNYNIIENGQNTEKSPGDLRRLAVTQTPGGARGVVVIVVGNGHGDTSSNLGRDWLHFTLY